nr:retrotransposon protein, putative, Ty1-copia subclass [Tanacetum cinerariifolium]
MTTSLANNSVLRGFFEKQKLTGPNFIDWYRQLKIVLSIEDKLNYLEQNQFLPFAPVVPVGQHVAPEILAAHTAWIKGSKEIAGLMLMTIEPDIQRNLKTLHAHEMLLELNSVCPTSRAGASSDYARFSLLQAGRRALHEQTLPKNNAPALHAIRAESEQTQKMQPQMVARGQNHGKGKNKLAYASKPKIPPPPKREDPAKDSICHECGETGHWKRNCPQYLAELLKKKNAASRAGGSGIFVIELNTILNRSWIYETGCGTHICNRTHGLRASRKLKPGALSLYVGNGQREAVEAIDVFYLCLPSGLEIVLNNYHYTPSIIRGVIYVSCLYEDGFINRFVNNTIQVSRNNMVYFSAISRDGIFEIDLSNSYTNESSIYAMARKPYTHQVERAKDLLGLIHIDVCGPFKIMSRQGANYFVTFTDDFSRYGYVYLLKHKHEVFETFKVFQKEVENQLGKTIKSLRSDRGGEYTSQEFLDHLKDHGIIAHRTPPYTPQHNGVSERRNRTLLDMVRSMMSQTTLPKSFWDYALETAARILNMVPTKKVEKAPYEDTQRKRWDILSTTHPRTKSTRTRHAPDRMCLYIDAEEHELGDLGEPASYKAALLDPESEKWLNAMNVKMQSMKDNEVWVLVELPPNGKTVGSKWLFKKKTDMDGVVHTYKARLVAKGYTQTSWIDYEETFSPVAADIRAIRILIAIVAYYDYKIWQMDVKTAFLNGYLNEEVYMKQHKGFVNPKYSNRVKLIKIYRDRSRRLIGLCQSAYIEKILKRYCMENSKRGSFPMQEKPKLSKSQGASTPAELKRMQNVPYASAVGSIMYAVRCTRLDVAFAQNVTSRFQQNLGDLHWTTVKNILEYLRNTKDMFLVHGEAEYIAAFDASKEAVCVRKFISGLGITKSARHFRAKVHYLREVIEYGDVKLEKVHPDDNLADPFTKALAFLKHSEHTRNIGMLPASSLM